MEEKIKTKIVKQIRVDIDKCTGCRACELACSAFHARPRYGSANPAGSRIRVMIDELKDVYVPVRAGFYTPAECTGRYTYTIGSKEYRECGFCRVACPSRGYFKDPSSHLSLRCDMCESDTPLETPWCVTVCGSGALIYEERETTMTENEANPEEINIGLESLADQYGMQAILDTVARMSKTYPKNISGYQISERKNDQK
ncbi:MAG: (4Fe-4S)-binding protein [Desulfobacterales bacterium RIFOXYA12_FULL_46_15]|nr:MAG: (4Fe-4S)-binding protein [Desulfobacterales bacterium RIFOXYA12_FULL_46_15]